MEQKLPQNLLNDHDFNFGYVHQMAAKSQIKLQFEGSTMLLRFKTEHMPQSSEGITQIFSLIESNISKS